MSLNLLAPVFHPNYQTSSDPPILLCKSTTMILPLVHLFFGMPPQIIPSHAPSIKQPITGGTFILSLIQPTKQSKQDAAAHQPPGNSSLLQSLLQHQRNVYRLFTRLSNSSTNTWRQKTSTDRHYNLLSINCKTTLPYCALCSSPTRILPLKPPLPVPYLTLTLTRTLLHLPSHFPALMNQNFVVLHGGRCGTTQSENKQFRQLRFSALTQHARGSPNYGAEPHIKNLQTRKNVCRWNSNL